MADADAAARADLGFELAHHGGHAFDGRLVARLRRGHAHARAFLAGVVEDDALDFRAPEIDADSHGHSFTEIVRGCRCCFRHRPRRTSWPATQLRPGGPGRTDIP